MDISFARLDYTWHGYDKATEICETYPAYTVYRMTTLCGKGVGGTNQSMIEGRGDRVANHPTPICRECLLKIIEIDAAGA